MVFLPALGGVAQVKISNCTSLKSGELTRRGYFERAVFEEKLPFKKIQGTALLGNSREPAEDAFVEIFKEKREFRIAGCRTGSDGRFAISNLPTGKYVLRLSKDGGFEITDIRFRIAASAKRSDRLEARIFPGQ